MASKAYMSDRAARMEYGVSAAFQPSEQPRLSRFNAAQAESEARAILAETERCGEGFRGSCQCGVFTPQDGWRYMSYVWLSGAPWEGNAPSALAEALAAILPVLDALEAEARQ